MKKKNLLFFWLSLGGIILLLSAVLWPLMKQGFFMTDDGEWMVIRLSAFYQSLADGQFPVRYLGRLNNSYGYPVSNFLYPGFLYIGSVIHFLGVSFPDAVKLILGMSVVGGAAAVYASLRTRYRYVPSFLGTCSFIFAPYLLFDIYHRGSVGEVLALFAASLIILGISRGWNILVACATGLLIVSHNTVALIAGAAIGIYMLTHPKRTHLLMSAAFGVGMATFFWLPALAEKRFVRFDFVAVSNPYEYFISIQNAGLLGFVTVLAVSLALGVSGKLKMSEKTIIGITLFGFMISLPISFPFWSVRAFAEMVQFPYRFLVLPVLFGPWIVAYVTDRVVGMKRAVLILIFVIIWVLGAVPALGGIKYVERAIGYYTTNEATTNVADEYMPRWVSEVPTRRAVDTLEIIDGDATLTSRMFSGEQFSVKVDAKEKSILQINKIYYPGWGVTVDNKLVPINFRNQLGVIRVEVPDGVHEVKAEFRETPFRFFADVVSLVSGIVFLIVVRRLKRG